MTSAHPLLLEDTVAMDNVYPSLLSYHYSDKPMIRDHCDLQPVVTVLVVSSASNNNSIELLIHLHVHLSHVTTHW
jgi:hypothetical protein